MKLDEGIKSAAREGGNRVVRRMVSELVLASHNFEGVSDVRKGRKEGRKEGRKKGRKEGRRGKTHPK